MVNWKGALVLLVLLAAIGAYAWNQAHQVTPPVVATHLVPCGVGEAVYVRIEHAGQTFEMMRDGPEPIQHWRIVLPVQGAADQQTLPFLLNGIYSISAGRTVDVPAAIASYGLTPPSRTLTCRVGDGGSYTLSVGNKSFDGSGYYAQKSGDARVYVIAAAPVDQLDQAITNPPVQPSPVPAVTPSP